MSDNTLFDLRPLLTQGIDPLQTVVERARAVGAGGALLLVAPFNPLPLRRVLAQMGFSSTALRQGDGEWRISLLRDGRGRVEGEPTAEDCPGPADLGAPVQRQADGLHIDVRGLEAPQPMVAILRLCASLGEDAAVIVHHDRDPVYLYPELAEIGWTADPLPGTPGEVRLLLRRGVA